MKSTRLRTQFVLDIIKLLPALMIVPALVLAFGGLHPPKQVHADLASTALLVQVEASQGFAVPGNALPANFLVVVSDSTGAPVTDLTQAAFSISNQFGLPGQTCGFSNNIVSFDNVLNGAYRIQVDLVLPACTWVEGDYLAYVAVANGGERGQAPATLSVRCPEMCRPNRIR